MYLKKLEIQGFKSFADKICLEFNSGVTCVVGPNGSGKSNIADSIRWVLGEQSVKTLRGGKMEDVIFTGTEQRKPTGFAEVSITIDNADNALPVAFSEVTVTRRVYRSGESEYMINKAQCRLKDIHELFLDTGLGRDGYSIIGQGRVDEILSTKSEDRRLIFEEASGIMKYKVRKAESEKKLDSTMQNLCRINDILGELEVQLEPLSMQSEVAKKYLKLRDDLKELEVNVYIENVSRLKEKLKELDENYLIVGQSIELENNKLDDITNLNKQVISDLEELEASLDIHKKEYYDSDAGIQRCNSDINLNREKVNNFLQNIESADNDIVEIRQKNEDLTAEIKLNRERVSEYLKEFEENAAKLKEKEGKLDSLAGNIGENEQYIEKLKSDIMHKINMQSDKKTLAGNAKNNIENSERRLKSLENEVSGILKELDTEQIKKDELSKNISDLKESISKLKEAISVLKSQNNELCESLKELSKNQNAKKGEIQFKESRQKILKDMEKNLEGYYRSVKVVLSACESDSSLGEGVHGVLAKLLRVPKQYETAIEVTLGGALQNIVTETEFDAKRVIEYLKKNKLGRATFLPVSSVRGKYFDDKTVSEIAKQQGFLGVASDLIEYDPKYSGIVLSLLGKTVIVENIDFGINIAKKFGYSFKIVTLEGDVLNTGGSMSGGSNEAKESGILGRGREISELSEMISKLKSEELKINDQINDINVNVKAINEDTESKESELKNSEMKRMRDEGILGQVLENIKKIMLRLEVLNGEKNHINTQMLEIDEKLKMYLSELEEIENSISEAQKIVTEREEQYKGIKGERERLMQDITDCKILVNSVSKSMESARENILRLQQELEQLNKSIEKKEAQKLEITKEINVYNENIRTLNLKCEQYSEYKASKGVLIDEITERRKKLVDESSGTIEEIRVINKNIMVLKEEFGKIEVKKARLESETELLQNRMWDEYELTYGNALALKKDLGDVVNPQKKVNEYKAEIRDLGPVNIAAIEEYVKVRERYEFMSSQKEDMEQAQDKLKKVIQEMTSVMKKQFVEQFKLINENFNIVFKELFGGGRANLILVDENNVLESGIEIEAQPPGKKLQNMMLLSGGERAFTAIALLFSILKLRPAPFCVLDEIEAALDDSNVYRFARYVKSHVHLSQFVMVTHRKGTMEAADSLYGVTMQEHGVSKVLSMKLGERAG